MNGLILLKSIKGGFTEKPSQFAIGGYEFVVDGKNVQFDWNDTYANCEIDPEGHLLLTACLKNFNTEDYSNHNDLEGVTEDMITAEFLTNVSVIEELYYECYYIKEGEQVSFENSETHVLLEVIEFKINNISVNQSAIDDYNTRIRTCVPINDVMNKVQS